MKLYEEMVKSSIHDKLKGREDIEWANYWYDNSNKESEKRILLIGDSTARMVRSTISAISEYSVDLLATSSGLHDILFVRQVDSFFASKLYVYDAIFVQVGHHSRIGEEGKIYTYKDYKEYEQDIECFVDFLKQYTNKIILLSVFYSVKPIWVLRRIKSEKLREKMNCFLYKTPFFNERLDSDVNVVKEKKNKILEKVALEKGICFYDINSKILESKFVHIDHIHYENKAKKKIAEIYINLLK